MGNGWSMGWMWFIWPIIILAIVRVVRLLVRGRVSANRSMAARTAWSKDRTNASAGDRRRQSG